MMRENQDIVNELFGIVKAFRVFRKDKKRGIRTPKGNVDELARRYQNNLDLWATDNKPRSEGLVTQGNKQGS